MTWNTAAATLRATRGVATLVQGVWNDILSVQSDGVWVRSVRTHRRRFVPAHDILHPHEVRSNGCVARALGRAVGTC